MLWSFFKRHAWWIVPLVIADIFLFRWLFNRNVEPTEPLPVENVAMVESEAVPQPGLLYGFPTAQTNLWDTGSTEVYMPTASGRVESALYGSTRTRSFSGRLLPAFHEGIDIAPMRRDRRGRPLDEVFAVADGHVVYINRVAGNSTYGIYVVVVHQDPMGEIYTLYSHLARARSSLREGQTVARGDVLGVMGNTASSGIPMVRAHLHFEIGVINNARFDSWYRAQRLTPDHGKWHGHNLTGIDPLAVFGKRDAPNPVRFSMLDYLQSAPVAFKLAVQANRSWDYFARYPALWEGEPFKPGIMVVYATEGGVISRGRMATHEEVEQAGSQNAIVLFADDDVLGRNGLRLVQRRGGNWIIGRNGERWLEILAYGG